MVFAPALHMQAPSAHPCLGPYAAGIQKHRVRHPPLAYITAAPGRMPQMLTDVGPHTPTQPTQYQERRVTAAYRHDGQSAFFSVGSSTHPINHGLLARQQEGRPLVPETALPASDAEETVRHARLVSSGAPPSLNFLDGEWTRSTEEPEVGRRPHYVKGELRLLYDWHTRAWQVSQRGIGGVSGVLALAESAAEHPNTVAKATWKLREVDGGLSPCSAFDVSCCGPNTPDKPFLMDELGRDFFVRSQPRKQVIWFKCPRTGQTFHSGAKKAGMHKAGNRYCPMCHRCFSANNFKSQHLRSHERAAAHSLSESPNSSAQQTQELSERRSSSAGEGADFYTLDTISSVVGDVTSEKFCEPCEFTGTSAVMEVRRADFHCEFTRTSAVMEVKREDFQQPPRPQGTWSTTSFDPVQEVLHSFPGMG